MYMASITDKIELFINELMNNSNSIQIKRNELANLFNCAPSQINYVLMTRFTIDRGYYIDSKKGGGGYVQITKISSDKKKYIKKYHGNQLKEKIIDTLLRKGYNYEHIKELLNEEGALNDE